MDKKVTIYTTPSCMYCKMAKELFKEHNIKYSEHDVLADQRAREEMFAKSGQMGVPVITINDYAVVGFDRARLSELLGLNQ